MSATLGFNTLGLLIETPLLVILRGSWAQHQPGMTSYAKILILKTHMVLAGMGRFPGFMTILSASDLTKKQISNKARVWSLGRMAS